MAVTTICQEAYAEQWHRLGAHHHSRSASNRSSSKLYHRHDHIAFFVRAVYSLPCTTTSHQQANYGNIMEVLEICVLLNCCAGASSALPDSRTIDASTGAVGTGPMYANDGLQSSNPYVRCCGSCPQGIFRLLQTTSAEVLAACTSSHSGAVFKHGSSQKIEFPGFDLSGRQRAGAYLRPVATNLTSSWLLKS